MFRKQSGFTLIELLVVISIIALLMALVLPTLRAARETARSVKCLTQIKQIHLAIEMYANDHGYYPPTRDSSDNWWVNHICQSSNGDQGGGYLPWTKQQVWGQASMTDLARAEAVARSTVFWCPEDPRGVQPSPSIDPDNGKGVSYLPYKGYPAQESGLGGVLSQKPITIRRPSDTAMLMEAWETNGGYFGLPSVMENLRYRHQDVMNVVYVDGHADGMKDLPPNPNNASLNPQYFWGVVRYGYGY